MTKSDYIKAEAVREDLMKRLNKIVSIKRPDSFTAIKEVTLLEDRIALTVIDGSLSNIDVSWKEVLDIKPAW